MTDRRELREHSTHLISSYHRGIICAGEMWMQIADQLESETVFDVLDTISPQVKEQLVAVWLDRPPTCYTNPPPAMTNESKRSDVGIQVVRWCEKNRQLLVGGPQG
jgi:hypothetical protein